MEFTRFDRVRALGRDRRGPAQEIHRPLLQVPTSRNGKPDHLEYHDLREDDPNFVQEYRLLIDQSAGRHQDEDLGSLKDDDREARRSRKTGTSATCQAYWFGNHLYQPLLHLSKSQLIEVSPVSLNDGERDFVLDLRKFYERARTSSQIGNFTFSAT